MGRMTYIVPDDARIIYESEIQAELDRGDPIALIAHRHATTPQTIHNVLRRMGFTYSRTKGWRKGARA